MGSNAMAASWRTLLLFLCLAILRSEGSCFGRDASFTPGAKPVVTQPSRNDPSKVMVDWSKIVKNAQCVDKFVVWMWPDGTEIIGKSAVSKEVSKTTMSAIMDMEACVNYRFAVELDEKEMTGNKKFSGEQLFKTAGQAKVLRLSASDFTVGYHWDPVRQVSDLRLASVSFPRSAIEHASCLDYIQVTGEEVRAGRPTLSRQASTASMTGRVHWSHLPPSPRPGSPISVGSASTLPASLGFGRSSSVISSTSRSSSGSSGYVSPFGPVETPRYANSLPRRSGEQHWRSRELWGSWWIWWVPRRAGRGQQREQPRRPFYQKTPASTPPTFLFWMPAEKQWMVGPTKGNKSGGIYSSTKNSLAVCPGDPPSSGGRKRQLSQ